jgi:transcription elongation factor GreA
MPDKLVPLTADGKARLQEELEELRSQRRTIAERIHDAQELGTSQSDAEYDDAKLEQGMVEGRILEIEDILRRATMIDEATAHKSGRVVIGSGVVVEQDGKKQHYTIVGAPEADPRSGRISNESPVGRALLGKAVGDVIDVSVPRGVIKVKVVKID